jgi:hypothetical protein
MDNLIMYCGVIIKRILQVLEESEPDEEDQHKDSWEDAIADPSPQDFFFMEMKSPSAIASNDTISRPFARRGRAKCQIPERAVMP